MTGKEISACNYLLKIIKAELSTSVGNSLILRKSATTYSWKRSSDKKLAQNLDIVLNNLADCKQYIINEMTGLGYTNIKLTIESSTRNCSTEDDWQKYDRKLEEYYSHSSAYRKYFNAPDNEKNGYSTCYTFDVDCKTDDKALLRKGNRKFKTFSDFYFAIDDYIYTAIKVITVAAIIIGLIFFVGRPVVKFIKGAADVVDSAFGINSDDDEQEDSSSENVDTYYVMADDCDAINIRQNASMSAKVLTVVRSRSMKLIPTGERTDEWIQVRVDGWLGWVFHEVVKEVK